MIYRRTRRFKKSFQRLPQHIQEKAIKAFSLFKDDPRHPSLRIKKMQGVENIWEGSVDISYRFTFHFDVDEQSGETICVFRNIGPHDILDSDY
jgi:mRNA-degrading endonuclease RelE of RelBE toxin-antitoxin system